MGETTDTQAPAAPHHHGHDVGERLYIHRHSVWHQLPAHPKIVAMLGFVIVVVATPITQWPSFVAYALVILGAATIVARIPLTTVLARAVIEVPFVFFALLMPFFGAGERIQVGPLELSEAGLLAGTSILAKGTLGVLAAVLLSTTTTAREVLRGLERLRLPAVLVQIASFMMRYLNVVSDEMQRMAVAREARGFSASGVQHWRVVAQAAGALFIRSYERGERVHLAMLARGYDGVLPNTDAPATTRRTWLIAMALPAAALAANLLGRLA